MRSTECLLVIICKAKHIDQAVPCVSMPQQESEARGVTSEEGEVSQQQQPNSALHVHVLSLIDQVKPHLVTLLDDVNDISLWIQMLTPKITEGNNLGVEIQQNVLNDSVAKAEVSRPANLHLFT